MTNQTVENCQFLNDSTNAETLKSNDTIGFHVESEMDMKRSEQLTVTTDALNPIDNSETPPKNNKLSDLLQSQDVLVETSLQNRHSTLPNDEVNELSVVEDHIITETEAKPDIESPNSDKEVDNYSTHNNDFGNAAATSTDGSSIDKDNEKTRSHSLSASENIPENILAFDFEINITPSIELELTLNTIDDEIESLCKMYKVPYFENTMFVNFQYLLLTDATIYMLYQDSGSYMKKLSFELDAIDHFVGDRHPKAILDLKECAECNLIPDSEKPFAFKIKMKDGSTSFALAAQDGESLRIWLTLLYENILTQNVWDRKNNAVCPGPGFVLGSLIITKTNVYICTTNTESEILKMISSCPIESIISVSKDKDGRIPYCCSLEYIIVESDESHSIPLCFATSFDCEKFIASITKEWRNLFKVDLSVGECEEYIIDTFNEYVEIFGESK
ncbi:uncharacterized protein TRIADDRAFT_57617 [Trichoplax adhaerens]|uniref:PH domain-containing protein n=1 Tax=Trichoplax adhaerens TaxID=10228 RepID=B3RZY3_TRIAD|nr:predicted protein [Trichoplax adhaerens]EDV23912.1 predicted protein [Trichoplax adhaerens]|eukprot:XP_002113438.1 predicted protein [Trichoplax adhaerens]